MLRNTFSVILISILLSACVTNPQSAEFTAYNSTINLMPMYGYPEIKKTESQKIADEKFIQTVVAESGSREKSAKEFAAWGWAEKQKGNVDNAMRRFNQSWLLDPNYLSYWGFGSITLAKGKPAKAAVYFEKALELIDDDNEKPRLLVDAAKSYALQGSNVAETDPVKSESLYKKSNSLIEKALTADPKYGNAYHFGALIDYHQGNYKDAWKIVKKARASGNYEFDPKFIEALSSKMAE